MPRWPWSRTEPYVDPNGTHAFLHTQDSGITGAAAQMAARTGGAGNLADANLTSNFQRGQSRCGVPGCGRDRSDPIHSSNG
jgi:hypothetical protein